MFYYIIMFFDIHFDIDVNFDLVNVIIKVKWLIFDGYWFYL